MARLRGPGSKAGEGPGRLWDVRPGLRQWRAWLALCRAIAYLPATPLRPGYASGRMERGCMVPHGEPSRRKFCFLSDH